MFYIASFEVLDAGSTLANYETDLADVGFSSQQTVG